MEGESRKIGRVIIPDYIYNSMGQGINLCIHSDIEIRIDNVLRDYVHGTDDELISSLNYLRKQLSHNTIDEYINLIRSKDYRPVIRQLMIEYYDPHYEYKDRKYKFTFENIDSSITADNIIKWIEESK